MSDCRKRLNEQLDFIDLFEKFIDKRLKKKKIVELKPVHLFNYIYIFNIYDYYYMSYITLDVYPNNFFFSIITKMVLNLLFKYKNPTKNSAPVSEVFD